ncbi:MAG: glycosyltransferase family 2 protein [Desulfuromonadaceae bacterium]
MYQSSINIKPETISIITPSYNQGVFLAETIKSVISQEGDFVLDYIIVDGGSTDNSIKVIKQYEQMLEQGLWHVKCAHITFRWVSEKDHGQTDALMKGFAMAEGAVLAWICSDDVYLPETLQAVHNFFHENSSAALLYGDAYYCDTAGTTIGHYPVEEFKFGKLAYFNFFCQPSTFFRREAFEAAGGLNSSLNFAMDYDLFVRIGKNLPCCYLRQYLSKYRLHNTSKTICNDALYKNHEESLRIAIKHFGWAPLNRVYGSCNYYCLAQLPKFLTRIRPIVILTSLIVTIFRSLLLNRGVRKNDLQLLTFANSRKLFVKREDILLGEQGSKSP